MTYGQLRKPSWKPLTLTLPTHTMLLIMPIFYGTLAPRTLVSHLAPKITPKNSNSLGKNKKLEKRKLEGRDKDESYHRLIHLFGARLLTEKTSW